MVSNTKQYSADYHIKNKQKIKEQLQELINCPCCKKDVKRGYMRLHNQTTKHKKNSIEKENKDKDEFNENVLNVIDFLRTRCNVTEDELIDIKNDLLKTCPKKVNPLIKENIEHVVEQMA